MPWKGRIFPQAKRVALGRTMPAPRGVNSLWLDFEEAGMETVLTTPEQGVSRNRGKRWPPVAATLGIRFVMMRKQMLNVKRRAEQASS